MMNATARATETTVQGHNNGPLSAEEEAIYLGEIDPYDVEVDIDHVEEEDVRDEDRAAFTVQAPRFRYTPVPDYVTWCPTLSDGAARTFGRIMSITPDDDSGVRSVWWTIEHLASVLGVGKSTLHKHLGELVAHGMMTHKKRWKKRGGQAPSLYQLIREPDERPAWPISGKEARTEGKRRIAEAQVNPKPQKKTTARKAVKRSK